MSKDSKRQTKIVAGVKVTINPEILTDWDVCMKLADVMDTDGNMEDQNIAVGKIHTVDEVLTMIFGQKQFRRIRDELRSKNGGTLPVEVMMKFLSGVFEEFEQKN